MNDMYWSGEAARSYSTYIVSGASAEIAVKTTLHATGPDADRFPSHKDQWLDAMGDLQNWTRASFVIAVCGAFERYAERIVRTALLSDPALAYKRPGTIDGVQWLKLGIEVPHDDFIENVTKGEWMQRYAAIKRMFGDIPLLHMQIPLLDSAREFRNSVGHAFGRNMKESVMTGSRKAPKMLKLKQKALINWFEAFSEAAKALDEALVAKHIGDFEPILHFHAWLATRKGKSSRRDPTFIREYTKALGQAEGHSKGKKYCEGLITYYDTVK